MVVFMLATCSEGGRVIEAGGPCPQHDARDGSRRGDGFMAGARVATRRGCGNLGAPRVEVVGGGSRRRAGRPQIVQTIAARTGAVTATPRAGSTPPRPGQTPLTSESFRTAAFRAALRPRPGCPPPGPS